MTRKPIIRIVPSQGIGRGDAITTFSRRFGVPATVEGWRRGVNRLLGRDMAPIRLQSVQPVDAPRAVAYVDKGNWWARCPSGACCGIEYIDPDVGLFFCCSCYNVEWGGAPLFVDFPDVTTRTEIERLLLARPNHINRNWRPGDSLTDIEADNIAHGVMEI